MASFNDLLNPSFLMFLGILVLVVALLVVYFESKMREQNHKISSMVSLVSAMAEELGVVKSNVHILFSGGSRMESDLKKVVPNNNKLIAVSDDEDDEDEDEDEGEDSDLEEDEQNSNDDGDDNDEESTSKDSDSDDETAEEDNIIELSEKKSIHLLASNIINNLDNDTDVKILNINLNDLDNKDDKFKIHLENDELEEVEEVVVESFSFSDNENKINSFDLKTINISSLDNNNHLNEVNKTNESNEETNNETIDYKKFPIQKLKSVVSEKGLSTDVSKLKKNDLLKLLGAE